MKKLLDNIGGLDFYLLGLDEVDELMDFSDKIYKEIEDKSTFFRTSKEEVINHLENGSFIIGVYDEDKLVAFRMTLIEKYKDSLIYNLIDEIDEDEDIICNDSCMVDKNYRGRSLQNITRDLTINNFLKEDFRYFYSTVSNKNYHSFKNVFKNGYTMVDFRTVYHNKETGEDYDRCIFYRDMEDPFEFLDHEKRINHENIEEFKEALNSNYYACDCDDKDIIFKKLRK